MENTGFNTFCLYTALKFHFTTKNYHYFKYNGKTKVTPDTFLKNRNKYQYYKLSRKYNLEETRDFLIANFVYGNNKWIGDVINSDGEETYLKWQKINQSLTYRFKEDVNMLMSGLESPEEMIKVVDGQYPMLLVEVMGGTIAIETVVILNELLGFFPMWSKKIIDDIAWPEWQLKIEKYAPFLQYDKSKFKSILKELIEEHV